MRFDREPTVKTILFDRWHSLGGDRKQVAWENTDRFRRRQAGVILYGDLLGLLHVLLSPLDVLCLNHKHGSTWAHFIRPVLKQNPSNEGAAGGPTSFFSLESLFSCSRLKAFFAFFICVLEITAQRWRRRTVSSTEALNLQLCVCKRKAERKKSGWPGALR